MYERTLDEAERFLAADREIIVAVKKLWMEVSRMAAEQGFEVPSFPDFSAMLEGDPRFEFLPFHKNVTDDLEDPILHGDSPDETEMEQMGFFSGDRVKLRSVTLTPQIMGNIIRSKVDRTVDALTKAWDLRPDGDRETEDQLLEILARTQKLQKEVKSAFSEERMTKLERSLASSVRTGSRQRTSGRKKGKVALKPVRKRTAARKPAMKKKTGKGPSK